MAGNLHEVSDTTFDTEVLKSATPVLVDFWAEWCGPCKALAPTIEIVANEQTGKVKVCKVDVDSNPASAAKFGVRSIPTVILFKNGQKIDQIVGNVAKSVLENLIQKA